MELIPDQQELAHRPWQQSHANPNNSWIDADSHKHVPSNIDVELHAHLKVFSEILAFDICGGGEIWSGQYHIATATATAVV